MSIKSLFVLIIVLFNSKLYVSQTYNKYEIDVSDFYNMETGKRAQTHQIDSLVYKKKKSNGYEIIKYSKEKINFQKRYSYDEEGKLVLESVFYKDRPLTQKIYRKRKLIYEKDYTEPDFKMNLDEALAKFSENWKNLNFQSVEIFSSITHTNKKIWVITSLGYIDDVAAPQIFYWDINDGGD